MLSMNWIATQILFCTQHTQHTLITQEMVFGSAKRVSFICSSFVFGVFICFFCILCHRVKRKYSEISANETATNEMPTKEMPMPNQNGVSLIGLWRRIVRLERYIFIPDTVPELSSNQKPQKTLNKNRNKNRNKRIKTKTKTKKKTKAKKTKTKRKRNFFDCESEDSDIEILNWAGRVVFSVNWAVRVAVSVNWAVRGVACNDIECERGAGWFI